MFFLEAVSNISKLQHNNIVELVGYCVEHSQHLLVYEFMRNSTLQDILHSGDAGDELSKKFSWNVRVRIALGAARALEYLHEICQPSAVHRNFNSTNILLDDELSPHLSDCGLEAFTSFGSESQVKHCFDWFLSLFSMGYIIHEHMLTTYTTGMCYFIFRLQPTCQVHLVIMLPSLQCQASIL